jgi:thioredoxin-related protein
MALQVQHRKFITGAGCILRAILLYVMFATNGLAAVDDPGVDNDYLLFEDRSLIEPLEFPDWFKLSFLDLSEDLAEVREGGKNGLIVYYGQKYCAYCKQFLEKDLELEDIRSYMLKYYDIIGIDIHGHRLVTDFSGETLNEAQFAIQQKTNFTPSVVFYSPAGEEALRLRGYYPPYRFRAALEYVADGHFRREKFREYLARADVPLIFEAGDLSDQPFFLPGPFMLDRSRFRGERPLAVFFEQGNCHACDVLHTGPLQDMEIRSRLQQMEAIQLSFWSDTPVVTPAGEKTTAKQWAEQLGLFYTPTLIFFDVDGSEIIRLDSVVKFFRLRNVLDYILTGGYRRYPTMQRWRETLRPPVFLE